MSVLYIKSFVVFCFHIVFDVFEKKKLYIFVLCLPKGSYRCGGCRSGYIGNQSLGCLSVENLKKTPWMCPDGTMCHQNGECVRSTTGKFSCEVSPTLTLTPNTFSNIK